MGCCGGSGRIIRVQHSDRTARASKVKTTYKIGSRKLMPKTTKQDNKEIDKHRV